MVRRIGITIGDVNGIGPEIILKSLSGRKWPDETRFVVIDPAHLLPPWAKILGVSIENWVQVRNFEKIEQSRGQYFIYSEPEKFAGVGLRIGEATTASGRVAARAIELAVELCLQEKIDAMVTAPISKFAVRRAGYDFAGHTEFLAHLCGVSRPVMLLLAGHFRVAIATRHLPVARVAASLTREMLWATLKTLDGELKHRFGISQPHIAVTGLNPHAGEQGEIGDEEIRIIQPVIKKATQTHMRVSGPFPADALFSRIMKKTQYDAFLAMYHDQGLIPLKMMAGGHGVNYTCGLPLVRTSPDHGTAFDIAGKNLADPSSMVEAIELALQLVEKRI